MSNVELYIRKNGENKKKKKSTSNNEETLFCCSAFAMLYHGTHTIRNDPSAAGDSETKIAILSWEI